MQNNRCVASCQSVNQFYDRDATTREKCVPTCSGFVKDNFCDTAACDYAYKVETIHGVSVKNCHTTCGTGFVLVKDSNQDWKCETLATGCNSSGQFYFLNALGDVECTPNSNTTSGCDASGNKLAADTGAHFKFHVEEFVNQTTNSNLKFKCLKSCASLTYRGENFRCRDTDCSGDNTLFREAGTVGENGLTTGTLYSRCGVTECSTVEYFYNDGTQNVCIESDINTSIANFGCENLGLGKYSLLKIETVAGNTKTMKECLTACPAT